MYMINACIETIDSAYSIVVLRRVQYNNKNNNNNIGTHAYGVESDGCGTNCARICMILIIVYLVFDVQRLAITCLRNRYYMDSDEDRGGAKGL